MRQQTLAQVAEPRAASADNENCPEQVYSVRKERQPQEKTEREVETDAGFRRVNFWGFSAKKGLKLADLGGFGRLSAVFPEILFCNILILNYLDG